MDKRVTELADSIEEFEKESSIPNAADTVDLVAALEGTEDPADNDVVARVRRRQIAPAA
jgi:hypothetical protein